MYYMSFLETQNFKMIEQFSNTPFLTPNEQKKKWPEYNQHFTNDDSTVVYFNEGVSIQGYSSYTDLIMTFFSLGRFLNTDSKFLLSLGASVGKSLESYVAQSWNVKAYDNCAVAVSTLKQKKIPCRSVNLDEFVINIADKPTLELSYSEMLAQDLKQPINVFAFRIFEYLDSTVALPLLLEFLINHTKSNSRLFISNTAIYHQDNRMHPGHRPNWLISFFAPRTDFKIHQHFFANYGKDFKEDKAEEIMVLEKL